MGFAGCWATAGKNCWPRQSMTLLTRNCGLRCQKLLANMLSKAKWKEPTAFSAMTVAAFQFAIKRKFIQMDATSPAGNRSIRNHRVNIGKIKHPKSIRTCTSECFPHGSRGDISPILIDEGLQ